MNKPTPTEILISLYDKQTTTAVLDTVRFELNNRMNGRIASRKQRHGDEPRLPNYHLEGSIQRARRFEEFAQELIRGNHG